MIIVTDDLWMYYIRTSLTHYKNIV